MRRTFAILCLFLASKSNVSAERSYGYAKKDELCNLDGLCINFLLEVTDLVLSKNECYLKCLRNLDCAWYTYNSEFGTCHLNMGCNDVVLLNQGFTRSYKDCEVLKSKQKSTVNENKLGTAICFCNHILEKFRRNLIRQEPDLHWQNDILQKKHMTTEILFDFRQINRIWILK